MIIRTRLVLALLPALVAAQIAQAGEITGLTGTAGDGFIFSDPAENVLAPGIKAVTTAPNDDDRLSFNGFSPSSGPGTVGDPLDLDYNCLMSNSPIVCNAAPGLGKRVKTNLTGRDPLDMLFSVTGTGGVTEYFTYGKTTNQTGARVLGLTLELGTGSGAAFVPMDPGDPATAVLFDQLVPLDPSPSPDPSSNLTTWPGLDGATEGQNPLQRVFFPGGLFGTGGQEGETGFFSDESAGFNANQNADNNVLTSDTLFNTDHIANFGDGLLDRSMIPDGFFWDDNDNPDDESALVAWYDKRLNDGDGAWVYGAIGVPGAEDPDQELATRVAALAAELGVPEGDLSFAIGGEVPADIVALMQGDALFEVAGIEDISNLNLNFSIDVGDIAGGAFTLRIAPTFAPIVSGTTTDYQFRVAGALDAANIPFLGPLADRQVYLDEITYLMGLPVDERNAALEAMGFSFVSAFSDIGFQSAQQTAYLLGQRVGGEADSSLTAAKNGGWFGLGGGANAILSLSGSTGDVDTTAAAVGYEFDTVSFNAGIEVPVGENLYAGIIAGYTDTSSTIDLGRGSLDANGGSVAAFLRGSFAGNGGFSAYLGYQSLSYDTVRNFTTGLGPQTALGSTDGDVVFAGLAGEYLFQQGGGFRFGPMGSIEHYSVSVDGFTETGAGAFNLTVGAQDADLTLTRIGVKGETAMAGGKAFGHLAWVNRSGDNLVVGTGLGGFLPAIQTPVAIGDDDWVEVGLGFSVLTGNGGSNTRIGGDIRAAVAGDGYQGHSARLFMEVKF